jgi:hypothetical protein
MAALLAPSCAPDRFGTGLQSYRAADPFNTGSELAAEEGAGAVAPSGSEGDADGGLDRFQLGDWDR